MKGQIQNESIAPMIKDCDIISKERTRAMTEPLYNYVIYRTMEDKNTYKIKHDDRKSKIAPDLMDLYEIAYFSSPHKEESNAMKDWLEDQALFLETDITAINDEIANISDEMHKLEERRLKYSSERISKQHEIKRLRKLKEKI